jgi:hypothetical protein
MPKPGWGAIVEGEPTDLEAWQHTLKDPSFDPWVEIDDRKTVLRSASLDGLASAIEVRDGAGALIARLNGAVALSQQARPLRFGGVIQFAADGKQHRTMFPEMAALEARGGFARINVTVTGPDGKPVPEPSPQPSEVQRWAAKADGDKLLGDALMYFGKGANWFDIYKVFECLFERAGGQHEFLALNWEPKTEVNRLKHSADWARKWARHAKPKDKPPKDPMNVNDAHVLLGRLLRRALG